MDNLTVELSTHRLGSFTTCTAIRRLHGDLARQHPWRPMQSLPRCSPAPNGTMLKVPERPKRRAPDSLSTSSHLSCSAVSAGKARKRPRFALLGRRRL